MRQWILVIILSFMFMSACANHTKDQLAQTLKTAQQPWHGSFWWRSFHDPLLNQFAQQLLTQNLDIQVAAARLTAARAVTRQSVAGLYPDISLISLESGLKNQFLTQQQSFGLTGPVLNWELDVFGRVRAGIRAAQARTGSAAVTLDDVRNLVLADLAQAVIDWRQAQETIAQSKRLLKAEAVQIQLYNQRTKSGLIDASFVERIRAERAQTTVQLPLAQAAAKLAEYQIERLLGDVHQNVAIDLSKAQPHAWTMPQLAETRLISIEVIKNRPDVRRARFDLFAAQADLQQAEANLWPKINILAFFGIANGGLGVRSAENPVWAVASLITAPILNFGRLRAAVAEKNAQAKALELSYENTILLALQETKTALSDYLHGLHAVKAQTAAFKRRQLNVEISKERFQRGLTDMSDLTTAQTELVQSTLALINQKTATARAFIRLQKALGLAVHG